MDATGLEKLKDIVDDTTSTATYKHIYRGNFDGTSHRHKCLEWGIWCWSNAFRHPQDIVKYFKKALE